MGSDDRRMRLHDTPSSEEMEGGGKPSDETSGPAQGRGRGEDEEGSRGFRETDNTKRREKINQIRRDLSDVHHRFLFWEDWDSMGTFEYCDLKIICDLAGRIIELHKKGR